MFDIDYVRYRWSSKVPHMKNKLLLDKAKLEIVDLGASTLKSCSKLLVLLFKHDAHKKNGNEYFFFFYKACAPIISAMVHNFNQSNLIFIRLLGNRSN